MIAKKVCPICKAEKHVNEFYSYFSKSRNKNRTSNYCKECARENSKPRALAHYQQHKEEKKLYAKNFRADAKNKEKIKTLSQKFKVKYREELQDCYVRDRLAQENGIAAEVSRAMPEIVETKRLQIKINRKIKQLKNGKK